MTAPRTDSAVGSLDSQVELEERFQQLAGVWRTAVAPLSSVSEITRHPAYQEIIALGADVVPLLLRELEHRPDDWFAALHALTGAAPIPPKTGGTLIGWRLPGCGGGRSMATPGERIEELFSGLRGKDYRITSPADVRYNCIAWAAGDSERRWWPVDPALGYYWPEEVERAETVGAFMAAFALLGYEACASEELESGYEKIAIMANSGGTPTHASRQLPGGRWTSKLGRMEDIEHDLHDVSGEIYGAVVQLMRRPSRGP